MTLAALESGKKYLIEKIDPSDPDVQRLMILGLVEGAEVSLASSAIGGDPIELVLHGNRLSLRRDQAGAFQVRLAE